MVNVNYAPESCAECGRTGRKRYNTFEEEKPCISCRGRGSVLVAQPSQRCAYCGGKGEAPPTGRLPQRRCEVRGGSAWAHPNSTGRRWRPYRGEHKLTLFWLIIVWPFVGGAIGFLIGLAIADAVCEGGLECMGWPYVGACVGGIGGPALGGLLMIFRDLTREKNFHFDLAEWIFDQHGDPQFIVDDTRFVDKSGLTVGWHKADYVYSLVGDHLGWYQGGVLFDSANRAVGFSVTAQVPPTLTLSSTPPSPTNVPSRRSPELKPVLMLPRRTDAWSTLKLEDYF